MKSKIVIACDVNTTKDLQLLIKETYDINGVVGYKIGANLAIYYGLRTLSDIILNFTESKILIYDHQKAGMDLPQIGAKFMKSVKLSHFDSVIIFPTSTKEVQSAWTKLAKEEGLIPIIGGKMTHWTILDFTQDIVPYGLEVYERAKNENVTEYVIPSNSFFTSSIIELLDNQDTVFYVPGIGVQGGSIERIKQLKKLSQYGEIVPIIGRSIYQALDIKQATHGFLEEMEN